MTGSTLAKLFLAGVFFALWPLLMKKSGLAPHAQSLLYALGAMAILVPWFVIQNGNKAPNLAGWGLGIACIATVINSIGIAAYLNGLGEVPKEQTGVGVLVTLITLTVVNEIASILLFGAPMTLKKLLGVVSAIAAFALLAL